MCLLSGPQHRVVYINKKLRELYGNREIKYGTPAREAWPELEGQGKGDVNIFQRLDHIFKIGEPHNK